MIYLQKAIVLAGVCSRRKAESMIKLGMVKVNGEIGKLGQKVDIKEDIIKINGKRLIIIGDKTYYLVNKPKGYITTVSDMHAEKKVVDLVPHRPKVWPIGRLDKDSRGLIILTNDGELTNQLTHPRYLHEKEYEVEVNKNISDAFLEKMEKGVMLDHGLALADIIKKTAKKKFSIILHQGWKRQIRRMAEKCGYIVTDLKRVRIGKIEIGALREGQYIKLKIFPK
ncbi:pseudouridine synthase [Candidatus Kuenenbacteria bacterium CG11_big_fil_rev_8_21_14_0_20_37_9]|uniref:Pseudouridine synthase n=2 Tax=Candidatus Kueneniibacteriota TaxID=1752740 RepID=A0A2M6XTA4_9BACT|nr:MAG: hypothetical protein AUJ29_01370 [Candidatus Kuenenbacteria bacterium CG1_02_38_13]PIR05640.1 MAG: pseudouridine synthase [Candidatus Kuenenbacteria bacterium CG11_big_fil_rev_8_21_14_0_20_37_9]PIU10878.1 MAG: rRNA pseudouridine synthase [Candidatus Kuenenbacteria bacterium CG08_land_8_20_14_0_20_37_23]